MMKRLVTTLSAVALLAAIPACSYVSNLIGAKSGPADATDLAKAVEQVQAEIDVSKEKMLAAVQALQKITEPDFRGDALAAHKELVKMIDRSEDQAEELRDAIQEMHAAAEPVFDQWTRDLEGFTNPEMRQRSQARLAAARERYDAVVAAVEPAVIRFDAVNETLRDHELFLSHDLNPAAVSVLQDDVRRLAGEAAELDQTLTAGRDAARAYVNASGMPSSEQAVPVRGS
jgi:hypothetical protein